MSWSRIFIERENEFKGYVESLDEARRLVDLYKQETLSEFTIQSRSKDFGQGRILDGRTRKVLWSDSTTVVPLKIEFDGVPYMVLGHEFQECHHGPDRNINKKRRYKVQSENGPQNKKRRFLVQNTKKANCPARILMREIFKFPQFRVKEDTKWNRVKASTELREALGTGVVEPEHRIYVVLPEPSEHKNHLTGEASGLSLKMDERLARQIKERVQHGVYSVTEMEKHLLAYVHSLFPDGKLPPPTNRKFFPTRRDIQNRMYLAAQKLQSANSDPNSLTDLILKWQNENPNDFYFLCPGPILCQQLNVKKKIPVASEEIESQTENFDISGDQVVEGDENGEETLVENDLPLESPLLFVHQTQWQKRLLNRYGQEICLLDGIFKGSKAVFQLYFIYVKTNVDYSIVGCFVTHADSPSVIKKAINVFRTNNPFWSPKYFLTELSEAEIQSIEEELPETTIYISDYHREQAWSKWLFKGQPGIGTRDDVLQLFRKVASAETMEEYQLALNSLQDSSPWKSNVKLRQWFTRIWLPEIKRWVRSFQNKSFSVLVNTSSVFERQHGSFQGTSFGRQNHRNLSLLLSALVTQLFPEQHKKYVELNVQSSSAYKQYNKDLPTFLINRPRELVLHILHRYNAARQIPIDFIHDFGGGQFVIASEDMQQRDCVTFFGDDNMPSCQCDDWKKHHWPCKHICSVFLNFPMWNWDALPEQYRNSSYFVLDEDAIQLNKEYNGNTFPSNSADSDNNMCNIKNSENDTGDVSGAENEDSDMEKEDDATMNALMKTCRDELKSLIDVTYRCNDKLILQQMLYDLNKVKLNIKTKFEERLMARRGYST